MQNQGLGHVVFYVRNLERSLHFYRDLLGLQEIGPSRLSFRAAALTSGRTHHELLLIEVGDAPGPLKGHRIGLYHVAFKVGDSLQALREARDELRAAGIVLTGASDHTVSQSLYLLDPDENEVELYVDDPAVDWRADPALVLSPVRHLDLWGA